MSKTSPVDWIAKAIQQATKSTTKSIASGTIPAIDPGLVVDGLGHLRFPLKPAAVKSLKETGQIAPYGKGTETLVNTSVRNTIEVDPSKFQLSDEWNAAIADVTRKAGQELGLKGEQLEAKIYKLLIYEKGGFFLPHRDSEKLDRMVASMIVVLPNPFGGGELHVRHNSKSQRFDFRTASRGIQAEFVAFYADCEHEVKKVSSGLRICLAYNLVLKGNAPRVATPSEDDSPLLAPIQDWVTTKPTEPLIFALEHHYTEKGLSLELLKGADRELADLVVTGADEAGCVVNFTQIEWHPTYSAIGDDDYGGYGWGRRNRQSRPRSDEYTVEELITQEFGGSEWMDLDGNKQPWGGLTLDTSAVVSKIPLEDWVPTQEEYEGYTGNAGNTLDRWYHRTALVVWHRSRHYEILATCGGSISLPMFEKMVGKLPKTAKAKQEDARNDCVCLARGILSGWPVRWASHSTGHDDHNKEWNDFPNQLLQLNERSLNTLLLAKLAMHDEMTPLKSFILTICREHGWATYTKELKAFFLPRTEGRYAARSQVSVRDAEWLRALCLDKSPDESRTKLVTELCRAATEFYCKQDFVRNRGWHEKGRSTAEKILPVLVQALLAAKLDDLAATVIAKIRQHPKQFSIETGQLPTLKEVVPWCQEYLGEVPTPIGDWLAAVRETLASSTKSTPEPPKDWQRPTNLSCNCARCQQLKTYLADATQETGEIRGLLSDLEHLQRVIETDQLDAKTSINRKTRPFTLVLTKSLGSYERAVTQYEVDGKLLKKLPTGR